MIKTLQKVSLSSVFFLSIALVLPACNPTPNSPSSSQSTQDRDTLKLLYWQAPTILNPHLSTGFKDQEASRITLEPLASFDGNGKLQPFLAAEIPTLENGGVAKDGKSVTWQLKKGVKWSDGQPFTAEDVVFTFQFITNPETGATTAGSYTIIQKIEALDNHTLKIHFKDINPAWFTVFVGTEGMILPKHKFAEFNGKNAREAEANLKPVGTGPYRVVQFKPGDVILYEANPEYRDAATVSFKKVELKGGGDAASAARAVLQTGDADFAYNLQVEANVLKELEAAGKGQLSKNFGALMERILINHTDPNKETKEGEKSSLENPHPFLTKIKLREALSLAVDRATIATQLYGSLGKPTANFIVAPPVYAPAETKFEYNLTKAAQLLEQEGWKDTNNNGTRDKNGVELKIVFQTSVNPLRQKTQEIIKQSLQSIGVGVELKSIDPSVYFSGDPASSETVERFTADLQMYSTGNTNPDPSSYLKTYTCSQIPQQKNNWTGDNVSRYCNREYDALWAQAVKELDPEKRKALYITMGKMLVQRFDVIPLVHRAEASGVSNRIEGVNLTPWDLHTWNIAKWKIKGS